MAIKSLMIFLLSFLAYSQEGQLYSESTLQRNQKKNLIVDTKLSQFIFKESKWGRPYLFFREALDTKSKTSENLIYNENYYFFGPGFINKTLIPFSQIFVEAGFIDHVKGLYSNESHFEYRAGLTFWYEHSFFDLPIHYALASENYAEGIGRFNEEKNIVATFFTRLLLKQITERPYALDFYLSPRFMTDTQKIDYNRKFEFDQGLRGRYHFKMWYGQLYFYHTDGRYLHKTALNPNQTYSDWRMLFAFGGSW